MGLFTPHQLNVNSKCMKAWVRQILTECDVETRRAILRGQEKREKQRRKAKLQNTPIEKRKFSWRRGPRRTVTPDGLMECFECRELRPLAEYYRRPTPNKWGTVNYDSRCDTCRKKRQVALRHGISIKQYDDLLCRTGGTCGICGSQLAKPNIDHCHNSRRLRGVLCSRCNSGIGQFLDSPELLRKAAEYLEGPGIEPPIYSKVLSPKYSPKRINSRNSKRAA